MLLRRATSSDALVSPRKKCACLFSKKSKTTIEAGAFSVWIKTLCHIKMEVAEGSQMRGNKGEEEAEEETQCGIASVKHAF